MIVKVLVLVILCVSLSHQFDWQPGNWAMDCDFEGNDIANVLSKGEECSSKCRQNLACSHYVWTNYNGGTCWLKSGSVSKEKAVYNHGAVCGIIFETTSENEKLKRGQLLWADEFNYLGPPNSEEWNQETGGHGWGNNELQYYTTNNARAYNGELTIASRKENYGNMKYTSSRLISKRKFRYGVIEYRAKLSKGKGSWPAFWLLAAKRPLNWPTDGEIDVMEHVGYDPNRVHATIHTQKYNHMVGTQKGGSKVVDNVFDQYHTYSLDWNSSRLKFYIDDSLIFAYYKEANAGYDSWPFDQEFNIIINTAIGGNWGGAQGVDDSIFPCNHVVDYVRHYSSVSN